MSNENLTQDEIHKLQLERLQFKWDIYLLTQFFTHKNLPCYTMMKQFCTREKVERDQVINLLRVPIMLDNDENLHLKLLCLGCDVYQFVAQYLKPLYKHIESKDLTDIFDIAFELKNSKINTRKPRYSSKYLEFKKARQEYANKIFSKTNYQQRLENISNQNFNLLWSYS